MTASPVLIYLHGFRSSAASEKAQETIAWVKQHRPDIELIVPDLHNLPDKALQQIDALVESVKDKNVGLIGSSLGGFYCAWLSARYNLRAALINPGVHMAIGLKDYLGQHQNMYTGETFELTQAHLDLFAECAALQPNQENLKILLQTGDETLDYRNAMHCYPNANIVVEEGGSHSFDGYDKHLPSIIEFLNI